MTQGSVGWGSRIETSGLASGISSDAEVFYSMLTSLNFVLQRVGSKQVV